MTADVHTTGPARTAPTSHGHARDAAASPRPPVSRGNRVFRLLLVILLMGGLLGGLWWFRNFRDGMIAQFFAGNVPPPTPVNVAEAKAETVPKHLPAIGTLEAVRQVTVSPEVAGRVTSINFESGATVAAGAALVQLNDQTEQADLLAYRAQAKLAELNLERSTSLLRRQAGPQTTVDQNRAELDEANANIKRTESLIAQKLIRAPFAGELGIRRINVGEYLTAGGAVVTLTDATRLYVNFTLQEQARPRIRNGQAVQVETDAYPGRTFQAAITTIEPQVTAESRTVRVQATLDNADRALSPGMFADVRVVLPPAEGVLTVPETAVDYTLYGDSVYVVRTQKGQDGKDQTVATRVPVATGDRSANRVEIKRGVQPGDKVIVSGQMKLGNGAPVQVVEGNTLPTPAQTPVN